MKMKNVNKKFKNGSYSSLMTLLLLIALLFVNFIVNDIPVTYTKFDVSQKKLFTLSEQTKDLLSDLKEDITVYYWVESGEEDYMMEELLNNYKALSSHIKIVHKDPSVYASFAYTYSADGLADNSLIVESDKRYRVIANEVIYTTGTGYTSSGEAVESTNFEGEDQLSSAIDYVTTESLPVLYNLSGHNEAELSVTLQNNISRENIEQIQLNLVKEDTVPEDADCVLINTPAKDISEAEAGKLKSYLQKGGNLFVILGNGQDRLPVLEGLLAEYGMMRQEGFVLEGDSNYTKDNNPLEILPSYSSHSITKPLSDNSSVVAAQLAQAIAVSEPSDNVKITSLLKTSAKSYRKVDPSNLSKLDTDEAGPFTLAADAAIETDGEEAHIIYVATPLLLDEDANTEVAGANYDFILNAVSFVCEHESMISIRAKNMDVSGVLQISTAQANIWSLILMILLPLGMIIAGFVVWIRRRRR